MVSACQWQSSALGNMASGDADELERGGLLAGDEDGELDITSSVTDADVQDFKDRLWEAVPPAKAPKSVQFVAPEPEPEPEPELEADAHAEPEPEDSVRDGSLTCSSPTATEHH